MKHYMILKSCVAAGQRRSVGEIIEMTDSEGNALIRMGRAEHSEIPAQVSKKVPAKKTNRAVKLEDSDAEILEVRVEDGASPRE